jgi:hypothetical protein
MATNYPISLDTFINPASGNTLDSPSHSLQHSDLNDAVEAIETKLGVGAATPGTATAYYPLVAGTAGETSWTQLTASGITSGAATSGQVLTANGSGAVSFAGQGLTQIVPTSVVVGSGSGSVSSTGKISFTTASSISINGCFSSIYQNYRIVINVSASSGDTNQIGLKLRVASTDTSTNYTTVRSFTDGTTPGTSANPLGTDEFYVMDSDKDFNGFSGCFIDLQSPNEARPTHYLTFQAGHNGLGFYLQTVGGVQNSSTQFDGASVICTVGNISGTISVYGYRN